MNVGGIVNKIESKADWIAALAGAWGYASEQGGGLGYVFQYLTNDFRGSKGPLAELMYEVDNPDWYFHKLLDSGHLYSTLFKLGALVWGAGELGFLTKYKTLGEKVAKGSAIVAAIMQGSGPSNGQMSRGAGNIRGY